MELRLLSEGVMDGRGEKKMEFETGMDGDVCFFSVELERQSGRIPKEEFRYPVL